MSEGAPGMKLGSALLQQLVRSEDPEAKVELKLATSMAEEYKTRGVARTDGVYMDNIQLCQERWQKEDDKATEFAKIWGELAVVFKEKIKSNR